MLFMNKYQQATHSIIGLVVFYLDLAVLIGIPLYTFLQGYGIAPAIIMIPVSLFIISPIVTFVTAGIGALIMGIWTSITNRNM